MAENENAQQFAARRRKEYIGALEQELEGYKRSGNDARAADVEAELKRVKSVRGAKPAGATEER